MKKIIVVCLLLALLPFAAHAGPCGDFEYAELQDMDQGVLLKEYCRVRKTTQIYGGIFNATYSNKAQNDFSSCAELGMKMERVYMKRFKIENRETLIAECK